MKFQLGFLTRHFQRKANAKRAKADQEAAKKAEQQEKDRELKAYTDLADNLIKAIKTRDLDYLDLYADNLLSEDRSYRPFFVAKVLKAAIEENDFEIFKKIVEHIDPDFNDYRFDIRRGEQGGVQIISPIFCYAIQFNCPEIALFLAEHPKIDIEKPTIIDKDDKKEMILPLTQAKKRGMEQVLEAIKDRKKAFKPDTPKDSW